MKVSLRWIFDHIDANWKDVDVSKLVDTFNKTTAEIEGYDKISFDFDSLSLVRIKSIHSNKITAYSDEWKKEVLLPTRQDAFEGNLYLVKRKKDTYVWAKVADFNCPKEGFVPAVYCDESLIKGGWKQQCEADDYIFEVDNKSITHRPDMWGHRGFAREIAAILDLPFKSIEELIVQKGIKECKDEKTAKDETGFTIKVENPEIGKRFAGLCITNIKNRPSSLWMALRLMRVGSRAIDLLVDITNYVMLDISQPMHAFDQAKLPKKTIEPRLAKKGEKLILLDDQEIELTDQDYVITNGKKPIALAGIMGGKDSGISFDTSSLFLESANFDASTIRRTSARLHIRTEASARFEKSLDPNQNVTGILRFLKLLDNEKIDYKASKEILSLGKRAKEQKILVDLDFIEKRLGQGLNPEFIVKTLEKIGFQVKDHEVGATIQYDIHVPTFRCKKDIEVPEDIVEEVGRFFGYENIKYELPKKVTIPYDLTPVLRVRKMKMELAFGLKMHEVCNYPFYDEDFLRKLGWEPKNYAQISNPVSEHWKRLVTSLIPHLLKNIEQNAVKYDTLRFFEWARIWSRSKDVVTEKKSLAGIFYNSKEVNFYDAKSLLYSLFKLLDMDVVWAKVDSKKLHKTAPWFFSYQTAKINCDGKTVGYAGKLDSSFFSNIFQGDAFAFELDGDLLLSYKPKEKMFKPLSKYPEVIRDVSMFVPLSVTVAQITDTIQSCDKKITDVSLIDFFQKDEWKDKKSLTFRFILQDYKKTFEKEEVDSMYDAVVKKLKKLGATLR